LTIYPSPEKYLIIKISDADSIGARPYPWLVNAAFEIPLVLATKRILLRAVIRSNLVAARHAFLSQTAYPLQEIRFATRLP
jgi:hypothetical protein